MDWEDVYTDLERVPPGKVVTYGDIATSHKSIPRAVGGCLAKIQREHRNRTVREDRTHRVVEDDGSVPDRPGGLNTQRDLLVTEGVIFINDKVDLQRCRARL
jgi:alkylated DNA nucleotide flippase Atl1